MPHYWASIFPEVIEAVLESKLSNLQTMSKRLQEVENHEVLFLLRHCFAMPKHTYCLRTSLCFLKYGLTFVRPWQSLLWIFMKHLEISTRTWSRISNKCKTTYSRLTFFRQAWYIICFKILNDRQCLTNVRLQYVVLHLLDIRDHQNLFWWSRVSNKCKITYSSLTFVRPWRSLLWIFMKNFRFWWSRISNKCKITYSSLTFVT